MLFDLDRNCKLFLVMHLCQCIALLHVLFLNFALFFILQNSAYVLESNKIYTNTWSIKLTLQHGESVEKINERANEVANYLNMTNLGQVGELLGHFVFSPRDSNKFNQNHLSHFAIEWFSQQEVLKRQKRFPPMHTLKASSTIMSFNDPLFSKQWHLHNSRNKIDCNVTGVWEKSIAGKGVVVAIVDDGVQWQHPDLQDNYCSEGSYDLNADDDDPTPEADDKDENAHGTRCAGEVAAVPNNICGVGVAYKAKFSGIRVLDGPMTDSLEAMAFNKHLMVNDVYSCSWGPEDDGKTVDGPRLLAQAALRHGIMAGRNGFGSIFVVASGNGGTKGDNCNYDGYASSIYTITIAAVDEFGFTPSYAEECTSMLASTVSSGNGLSRQIVTTDWTLGSSKSKCTMNHSGTSAATPLVAGMIALMLEARPCLTWRDVQYIIVMTANPLAKRRNDLKSWYTNAAGFAHSNYHGFGLLDAWKLVNAARTWQSLPWLTSLKPSCRVNNDIIPSDGKSSLTLETEATSSECANHLLATLESIAITISLSHVFRGDLTFTFTCPSGTESVVPTRQKDTSSDGLSDWTYSTVKCWGENAVGKYKLTIFDTKKRNEPALGRLKSWSVTLYGSQLTDNDIQQRKNEINEALSGKFLSPDSNYSVLCPVGQPVLYETTESLSEKTLKLVVMLSCAFVVCGLYYTFEMAFCNAEDKKENTAFETETISNHDRNITYDSTTTHENASNGRDSGVKWEDIAMSVENQQPENSNASGILTSEFL